MIGLDTETYSSANLPKVGLHNYVEDPHFQPLLAVVNNGQFNRVFDFVSDPWCKEEFLDLMEKQDEIAAHNAGFEREVLRMMGLPLPASRFVDTAVCAAYMGAGRSLEAAAAQLLGKDKYENGKKLIELFCIPGSYQDPDEPAFNPLIRQHYKPEWDEFIHYCGLDALLCFELAAQYPLPSKEQRASELTMEMNSVGWPVDTALVNEMQRRYESNLLSAMANFTMRTGDETLNLSSTKQMTEWCAKRGVRATSFDEEHVDRMERRLKDRLQNPNLSEEKQRNFREVLSLAWARQEMGGSSLKKLATLKAQTATDGRLYDQYLHYGAQATGRTTGRGVQMQNLPRLLSGGDDVAELFDVSTHWDNNLLAHNLRQTFHASSPSGSLIVGDFSSVESRGLAWQANEQWKLNAYRQGQDLYKVLAGRIFDTAYDSVTKEQRQIGKTGELSCGYGAGGGAVHAFARNMGVDMDENQAARLVRDWRDANPETVEWWRLLQEALNLGMDKGCGTVSMPWGNVWIDRMMAPRSLRDMGLDSSLCIVFKTNDGFTFTRYIHGVQRQGNNLTYHKPSARKTGDLWTNEFTDPKTGQRRKFSVYGGKLAGLLTQSLCREVFFHSLDLLDRKLKADDITNVRIIGQFHDEIVLEWWPSVDGVDRTTAMAILTSCMTASPLQGFPLDAEVKFDHRYTK